MLAAIGAAAGLLLGGVVSAALASSLGQDIFLDLSFDWRVALFTGAVAVAACLLFGLAPALRVFRLNRSLAQSAGGRGIAGACEGIATRRGLAVVQMALSLALVTGALLFIGNLRNLLFQNPGFHAEGVTIAMVDISGSSMPKEARAPYYLQLLDRIQSSSAVSAASEVALTPIGGGTWNMPLEVELAGVHYAAAETYINEITPGYFAAMQTQLLTGRNFNTGDSFSSPRVAIVNHAFVRQYLKGANPLGGRLVKEGDPRTAGYEIVGVAADAKYANMREEFHPGVYFDISQDRNADTEAAFLVRASGSMPAAADAVKAAVRGMQPQPILDLRTLEGNIRNSLTQEFLMATLSGVYGLLAAILAAVGVYGALSYLVARRRNEIGVRMALGATRGAVVSMILREAAGLAIVGLAIGIGLTLAGTRAAAGFLYGVTPSDPAVIVTASLALVALALLASFLPARRAAGIDPAAALRQE
jgi:predicted permease